MGFLDFGDIGRHELIGDTWMFARDQIAVDHQICRLVPIENNIGTSVFDITDDVMGASNSSSFKQGPIRA